MDIDTPSTQTQDIKPKPTQETLSVNDNNKSEPKAEPIDNDIKDDPPIAISETWKVKGFPQFFKTGHVKAIMISLGLETIDVYKKTPNITAYVRFKNHSEKLRAKSLIECYTEKKIKKLRCIEHKNRKQYNNDLLKKNKKRKINDYDASANNTSPPKKKRKVRVEPTSIQEVVTPLYKESYSSQLKIKHKKLCRDLGYFRRKMTNDKYMNTSFLTYLPLKNRRLLCPNLGIVSSPIINKYRNKVSFTIGYNKNNLKLTIGHQLGRFDSGRSSIEECSSCIHIDDISLYLAYSIQIFIREQYNKYKYDAFNKKNHFGIWRKLNIRISSRMKQYIIILQIQNKHLLLNGGGYAKYNRIKTDFTEYILNKCTHFIADKYKYKLNGLLLQINNTVSTVNNNDNNIITLYGNDYYSETICNLQFRISCKSFFQINTSSAERLYEIAAQWTCDGLLVNKKIVLFDICCGTGTIGLCIANLLSKNDNISKLIGLELIEDAINDAKYNAACNGFDNDLVKFVCGPAEITLENELNELNDNDYAVAILDPPRAGVHSSICKLLRKQSRIQRIIYVSCNGTTCASDAIRLCQTPSKKTIGTPFKPIKSIGVDLFPHTDHVEMIMHLERCKDNEIDWSKLSRQASEMHRKYLYKQSQKHNNKNNDNDKQNLIDIKKYS